MNPESLNLKNYSLEAIFSSLGQVALDFAFKLVAAVVILVVGIWVANRITASLRRFMEKRKLEPSLKTFLVSFLGIVLKVFVFVIVLATVGVQMTSIVAVLGAASLAVGMALSGTLQNFAGGIVILLFKPFKVGDSIETATGDVGVVKQITIFTTELHTFDNQVVFLPNGALANGVITNLSNGTIRRTDININLAYGTDIELVKTLILKLVNKNSLVIAEPCPVVFVANLTDSAVVMTVRYWTKYEDILQVQSELTENIYKELQKKKVKFPIAQMRLK